MGNIGKLDGDIETRNKKKQQYTNTYEERTSDSVETECDDCGCRLAVNHILCEYQTFQRQRIECNLSIETCSEDVDEIRKLIEYT
jgi:hypothetical protein